MNQARVPPNMQANYFFEQHVPTRLASDPQMFDLGRVVAFHITGPTGRSGRWSLLLQGQAECRRGIATAADCLFELSSTDFEQALADVSQIKPLFRMGRVGVRGSLAVAKHLPALLTMLSAAQHPSGLQSFFPNVTYSEFGWPDALNVCHGALTRVPELAQLDDLHTIHTLLNVWPGQLRLADRWGGRVVNTRQAQALYADGHHLAFSDAEQVFPVLKGLLTRLRWDLKLPIQTFGRCPIYASPDGVGEALHFDQNANFIVQLRGEKIWRVAPNRHLIHPTDRYTTAQPIPSTELQLYGPSQLPTTLPPDAQTIHLQPGSVLFMPRGYWHETQAVGDSLSLNFTFDQPTWADVLPTAMRLHVLPYPAWRALATGAGAFDAVAAQNAQQTLHTLLSSLPQTIHPHALDAQTLLNGLMPTESSQDLLHS